MRFGAETSAWPVPSSGAVRSGATGLAGSPNLNGDGHRIPVPAIETSIVPVGTTALADATAAATVIVCPEITGFGVTVTVRVPAIFTILRVYP